jgi:membrane-bound lytic murein transglycosylase B
MAEGSREMGEFEALAMMPRRCSRRMLFAAPLAAIPGCFVDAGPATAGEGDFYAFLSAVRRDAAARGIRLSIVDRALGSIQYLPHVIELDRHQPEQLLTFGQYLQKTVSQERKDNARIELSDNRSLLDSIWRRFAVEPRFIVALWGLESDFGRITGNYMVVSSLATLGFDGRRGAYFRGELISALRILDDGDIAVADMFGSWAGAMGQCQFMPSTFLGYAVDYDGDGRRDIWRDRADVLGSIANFLAHLGWRNGETWGREVMLPPGFDTSRTGLDIVRSTQQWNQMGVRGTDARPLTAGATVASLVLPDGAEGPALLVYDNFRTIMRWNKSTYFAAAVGYLADSMGGGTALGHG